MKWLVNTAFGDSEWYKLWKDLKSCAPFQYVAAAGDRTHNATGFHDYDNAHEYIVGKTYKIAPRKVDNKTLVSTGKVCCVPLARPGVVSIGRRSSAQIA